MDHSNAKASFLISIVLMTGACGSSMDTTATPGGDGGVGSASSSQARLAAPPGSAQITVTNTTASTLTVYVDAQGTPLWLHIGEPELLLNGYGRVLCTEGDTVSSHNDPFAHAQEIAPGADLTFVWNGSYVVRKPLGSDYCWQSTRVSRGELPARACAYEGTPAAGFFPSFPLDSNAGPPSQGDAGVPEKCVDFSLTLPASGEAPIDVAF